MIDLVQGQHPFVAFVGAGASAIPPSSLPTWNAFNDLLLECLCERLAEFSSNRQPSAEILAMLRARRDKTKFFAPDFQAQLIEEEVGRDYFRVWQSLESNTYGPVHISLAELASQGRIAAIITTNFDRLIETALRERDVAFEVFYDQTSFETLATIGDDQAGVLPVIKIHGSIEDVDSLVDTLKQRQVGRPESLMEALQVLLRKYHWLYLGFSGADFSYNPHYLRILDAADDAKGFIFLAREGVSIQEGVHQLAQTYGAKKATIVYGDLSNWLNQTFSINACSKVPLQTKDKVVPEVKKGIQKWTQDLGSIAVINILCSMLKSAGMEAQSLWLLRKTWKSYRSPSDIKGKSYDRYNHNYGMALMEQGFLTNPVTLAHDKSNLAEWHAHADQNAYQFFTRSYGSGKFLTAGAQLAAVMAYQGEIGKAIALADSVTKEVHSTNDRLALCDVAIASTVIYDLVKLFNPAATQLRHCVNIARELGDEPRRAALCAHLGRFLTYGGHFDEAKEFLDQAEQIARRLGLQPTILLVQAARGRWFCDSGKSDEISMQILSGVVADIHALEAEPLFTKIDLLNPNEAPIVVSGRHPILCRVLLDLNRAAQFAGNIAVINQTFDELDELATEVFPGYGPHYYLSYAECLLADGKESQQGLAADLISRARYAGEMNQNPWVSQAADRLQKQIDGKL